MNLNKELFLKRDFALRRKPRINLDVLPSFKKISYPNTNQIKIRYAKKPKDYYFENVNTVNNGRIINNIVSPKEKSYFADNNQSQINRDIYGYNNYIINKNSYNTINFSSKKNHNSKQDSISNFNYADTPNYLTTYESNSNIKFNNNTDYQYLVNSNTNENSFNNSDIKFMNMKLNFKILQQKLTHLNDIASSTEKNIYQTPYKLSMNTMSGYNSITKENNYPIKVFRSEVIQNNNNKLKKKVKIEKNENDILYQRINRNNNFMNNNNRKIIQNQILKQNIINNNKSNDMQLFRNKLSNKNNTINFKDRYFTNDNSLSKYYKKEDSELSQLADNILSINKSSENLENNYFIKDKSFETRNIKNLLLKKKDNNKNKNKNNNYKYISNELEEISMNKEYNQTQINNNEQNFKLMVEHIFSYSSAENKKSITEKNSDKGKSNKRNKNNKNINIVQTNNFILNNLTEDIGNKREQRPKIEKTFTDINLGKDNIISNNNKKNDEELNDDNTEDDGDRIINSLIATASQNLKKKEKELSVNNSITDFDKNFVNHNVKKKNDKKVSFDDELIYINYHQDYKVTNLHITDDNNKTIQFKPKDISRYIKKLTNDKNKLKPIIINSTKANYNNIINKIKIKNTKSKINKIKTNQTIQKNKDFIKEVEKRNNSRERSQSKEKYKNKDILTNSINIKVNKSKNVNNKITVNKK